MVFSRGGDIKFFFLFLSVYGKMLLQIEVKNRKRVIKYHKCVAIGGASVVFS